MQQRRIVFVIFEGFQSLDLVGPHEVFQYAGMLSGGYDCRILAPAAGLVRSTSGLPVQAGHGVADLDPRGIDTLVTVGGDSVDHAAQDSALTGWLAAAGASARRVTSVCVRPRSGHFGRSAERKGARSANNASGRSRGMMWPQS
ncbi:DJ-1/PfpI family protein [Streptomyces sp. NPDC001922]|uniref:DJ-1/PfpI family protein n=1 Tax=Streptomyces sp. NPDC001922 TaxID=3364624 RepID=UPI0036BDD925